MAQERVVAVIEARMGSSRLPGKSLRPIAGAPLVERVIERARGSKTVDRIVLATTTNERDDELVRHVEGLGVTVFRGSEDDVLARILGAAHASHATIHVQCWGDCPFLEPGEVDRCVAALREGDEDLVGNAFGTGRILPYGLDVIALRVRALEQAEEKTRAHPYHREHGTTYIFETPTEFMVRRLEAPSDLQYPAFNVTINTEDDYRFVCDVYDALYPTDPRFTIRDVMALIRSRPNLLAHPNARALMA
jgi:spore coat polysaccharide biosynthesis protein SpsF